MEAFIIFNISVLAVNMFASRRLPGGRLKSLSWVFAAACIGLAARELPAGHFALPINALPAIAFDLFAIGLVVASGLALIWRYPGGAAPATPRVARESNTPAGRIQNEFDRFKWTICGVVVLTGTALYFTGGATSGHRTLWLLPLATSVPLALVWMKPMFLLSRLARGEERELLFEDRFVDLARGLGALRTVLLDRKINAGRLLILNSEENLAIERTSTNEPAFVGEMPPQHVAALLEDYARLEQRVARMKFALMRYEQRDLERAARREKSAGKTGLRIQDPLLVLYHYLARPAAAFGLGDALDVIERDELAGLMLKGWVVRRPGSGLMFSDEAHSRVAGATGALAG